MREKISACVITYNEEQNIERCLNSLTWCDEIVVVDSFSTDRTLEICRRFTDQVHQHAWQGYIGQRRLIQQMARCPWVLFLDADEVVPLALRDEILREFDLDAEGRYLGYRFPRKVYYLGKWIEHGEWYPDIKLRLFRKDRGTIVGEEPHDQVVVNGPVKTLKYPLWHYTYDGIWDHVETINRFSTISARSKYADGARFSWRDFLFRPPWRFIKGYILKGGFLDGRRGYIIALISAFGVAVKYAKLWERKLNESSGATHDKPKPSQ